MLKVGAKIPEAILREFHDVESEGCSIGVNRFNVSQLVAGKRIAIFGLPGAFTPTCSAKHLPGFVEHAEQLRETGIDEIWCVSVNDAFVMAAWGREHQAAGRVRMMADGSADFTKAIDLVLDRTADGLGLRSQRYSMLVVDGVVRSLNVEASGKFEVSDALTMLNQSKAA
jgi:peroxiredoxin